MTLGDRDLSDATPVEVARAGLARTFQNLRLFKNLTVRENVTLMSLVAARHRSHRQRPRPDVAARRRRAHRVGRSHRRGHSTTATSDGWNWRALPHWLPSSCCSTSRPRA